jgi:hypothetical protein
MRVFYAGPHHKKKYKISKSKRRKLTAALSKTKSLTYAQRIDEMRAKRDWAGRKMVERLNNPTLSEMRFTALLNRLSVDHRREYFTFYDNGNMRFIDFYLPDYQLNIEIDGGYHESAEIKRKDIHKDLSNLNRTIRYRNEELVDPNFEERVKSMLILRWRDIYGKFGLKHPGFKANCGPALSDKSIARPVTA